MEYASQQLLTTATHKTLHAHGFSRASSQASLVLTDLLSRYLQLFAATAASYATHAGRTQLAAEDVLCGLDEVGVGREELRDWCESDGRDMAKYAQVSLRRRDDLKELRWYLSQGLRKDKDDRTPLVYAPYDEELDDERSGFSEEEEEEQRPPRRSHSPIIPSSSHVSVRTPPRMATPPLPLSPVSIPGSPARKRARLATWNPPDHVPDFLPPFPELERSRPSSPTSPSHDREMMPAPPVPSHRLDLLQSSSRGEINAAPELNDELEQDDTAAQASLDYFTQVPYAQSTISSAPQWHLPSSLPPPPPTTSSSSAIITRFPAPPPPKNTPQALPSLIGAYHHILTHPPPPVQNVGTPRHRVALGLMELMQSASRWEVPDSLYATSSPGMPRQGGVAPTYAIPYGDSNDAADSRLPPGAPPRSISHPSSTPSTLAPSISTQPSRIPSLAKSTLSGAVYNRTTKIGHPPVLTRGSQKLVYGPGVAAPWNTGGAGPGSTSAGLNSAKPTGGKKGGGDGEDAKGGAGKQGVLPDARLFATWDYEQKHFYEPLAVPMAHQQGGLARRGSIRGTGVGVGDTEGVGLGFGFGGRDRKGSGLGLVLSIGKK